eukprot:TRINITY_DN3250_c0_g1_i2.p4 TRINITY_DN3250_c0_g1~~TRINITY_DN3250_c0_g1_i2.p4  ORF type:complete len:119 (-),score=1.32 TRINITY_DN3250_c0_g1_i2:220-576(-)
MFRKPPFQSDTEGQKVVQNKLPLTCGNLNQYVLILVQSICGNFVMIDLTFIVQVQQRLQYDTIVGFYLQLQSMFEVRFVRCKFNQFCCQVNIIYCLCGVKQQYIMHTTSFAVVVVVVV